jgi:hypothetical protein
MDDLRNPMNKNHLAAVAMGVVVWLTSMGCENGTYCYDKKLHKETTADSCGPGHSSRFMWRERGK